MSKKEAMGMGNQMTDIIKDCWEKGLNEKECFLIVNNYSIFSETWKTVRMISRVYNALDEHSSKISSILMSLLGLPL